MSAFRSQPYRIQWPLSPSQVESVDQMFQILFEQIKKLSDQVNPPIPVTPIPSPPGNLPGNLSGFRGEALQDGQDGEQGIQGPQGLQGVQGVQGIQGPPGVDGEDIDNFPLIPSSNTVVGSFTQGSVLFGGPSGAIAQDNAQLFWDDTNFQLKVGTSLSVGSDATSLFRDVTIEFTGIAVRDAGNTAYRALRVSNFGIGDNSGIFTPSHGRLSNDADAAWSIHNAAQTRSVLFSVDHIDFDHQGGTNRFVGNNGAETFLFGNEAQTLGFCLRGSTADQVDIRNLANSDYGTLNCLGLKASGVAGFNGTQTPVTSITVVNGIVTAVS